MATISTGKYAAATAINFAYVTSVAAVSMLLWEHLIAKPQAQRKAISEAKPSVDGIMPDWPVVPAGWRSKCSPIAVDVLGWGALGAVAMYALGPSTSTKPRAKSKTKKRR